jgi:hypothetical protein
MSAALDFFDDTQTIRRWLNGDTISIEALVVELRRWADSWEAVEGSLRE